jgi:hypothetical protein
MLGNQYFPRFQQFINQFLRIFVSFFKRPENGAVHLFLRQRNRFVDSFEMLAGVSADEYHGNIRLKAVSLSRSSDLQCDFRVYKRVTVAVASRPEAKSENIRIRPVMHTHSQAVDQFFKNGREWHHNIRFPGTSTRLTASSKGVGFSWLIKAVLPNCNSS